MSNPYLNRTRRLIILLFLVVLRANARVSVALRYENDDESSMSRDGGGQLGRGTVNAGGQCVQCSDVGGSKCTRLRAGTSKCYQDSNPNLYQWIRKKFCLQSCADLNLGHPDVTCCPSSTSDDTSDNRDDTCKPQCTDKTSWLMRKKGIRCPEVKNLAKKCRKDWWMRWDLCRQSCFEAGAPYPGDDDCCGKDVVGTGSSSNCHDCSDLPTPWMGRNRKLL